jgi:hypothetical protein
MARHLAVPGNADGLDGEIRRLRSLRDHIERLADSASQRQLERWSGPAREQFDDLNSRLVTRLRLLGSSCDRAARALERYHPDLTTLQGLATVQPERIMRWQRQAETAAAKVATELHAIAGDLRALSRLTDGGPATQTIDRRGRTSGLDDRQPSTTEQRQHGPRLAEAVQTLPAQPDLPSAADGHVNVPRVMMLRTHQLNEQLLRARYRAIAL